MLPRHGTRSPAPALQVSLLGGLGLLRDGHGPLEPSWRRPGAPSLLKLLALAVPDHRLSRDHILVALWPHTPREAALNRLRVSVHEVRQVLEPDRPPHAPSAYVIADGEHLQLNGALVSVDLDAATARAETAVQRREQSLLRAAAEALSVPLLPGDDDEPWTQQPRRDLATLRRTVVTALAESLVGDGATAEATALLAAESAADPADEDLALRLMRVHLDGGRPREAARAYLACQRALAEDLGVSPTASAQHAYREALTALGEPVPPVAAQNLPPMLRTGDELPLVGRHHVLELVSGVDGPPLTLVTGEQGVGKTRLVAEAARSAAAAGAIVLWGTDRESGGARPFGALTDALEELLSRLPRGERATIAGAFPYLSALLPSMAALAPLPPESWSPDRFSPYQAITGLLARLSAGRQLLIVCDDLHAAPSETLRLVHHVVRSAKRRWRILATARDDGRLAAGSELSRMLGSLGRERLMRTVTLMRLAQDETEQLVTTQLAGCEVEEAEPGPEGVAVGVGARVYELSRGNPLLIRELVHAYRASGTLPGVGGLPGAASARIVGEPAEFGPLGGRGGSAGAHGSDGPRGPVGQTGSVAPFGRRSPAEAGDVVPERIRDLAADRLDRLPEPIRRVAAVLACANGPAPVEEVLSALASSYHPPMTEAALLDALESGHAAGLLEEGEVLLGGQTVPAYGFRHPVLRFACYQGISPARRRLIHRSLAEAVACHRPERVEDLSIHHLHAGSDAQAIPHLRRAARRAERLHANDAAEAYCRALVERLDARGEPAGEDCLTWGIVLRRLARHQEAGEVLRRAVDELGAAGQPAAALGPAARAVAELAEVHGRSGAPQEGLRLLDGHPFPTGIEPAEQAELQLVRARLLFICGRHDEHRSAATQAVRTAYRITSPAPRSRLLAEAHTAHAIGLLCAGRYQASATAAQAAVAVAESSGSLAQVSVALSCRAELAEITGHLHQALDLRRKARDAAERTGDPAALAFEMAAIARLHVFTGDAPTGARRAREAVTEARVADGSWHLVYPLLALAEALLATGDHDEAARRLEEATTLAENSRDSQALHAAATLTAQLLLVHPTPPRPAAHGTATVSRTPHETVREAVHGTRARSAPEAAAPPRADAALAALDALNRADAESGALDGQRRRATALRAEALAAAGEAEHACRLAVACAEEAAKAGERIVEAHAHLAHALALHRLGNTVLAGETVARAHRLATEMSHRALLTRTAALTLRLVKV